jgi:hypothetical protein
MLKLVRGCMAHGTRQLETRGFLLHGLHNWQQKGVYKSMFVLSYWRFRVCLWRRLAERLTRLGVWKGVQRRSSPDRRKNIAPNCCFLYPSYFLPFKCSMKCRRRVCLVNFLDLYACLCRAKIVPTFYCNFLRNLYSAFLLFDSISYVGACTRLKLYWASMGTEGPHWSYIERRWVQIWVPSSFLLNAEFALPHPI